MRSITLPEPPSSSNTGMPEIFDRGISCVVRRAVIIGNGAAGAEHQCIGLVRALGLSNTYALHVRIFSPISITSCISEVSSCHSRNLKHRSIGSYSVQLSKP